MKNVILIGLGVATVSLIAVAGAPSASAEPPADPKAAITLKDKDHPVGCVAFGLSTSDRIHTVATPSGNTKLTCHFTIPEGQRPAKVEEQSGFACGIFLPTGSKVTTDSSFKKTPGGEAKLECTIKL